jgi:hypothetical protein
VIGRCLEVMLQAGTSKELEIVVVCKRPHRSYRGRRARVRQRCPRGETARASKTAALNLGDACVAGLPRFYLPGCGRHGPACVRPENRRASRRRRCAGGVAGHGRRSARLQPGCKCLPPRLDASPYVREGMSAWVRTRSRRRAAPASERSPRSSPTTGTSHAVRRQRMCSCR